MLEFIHIVPVILTALYFCLSSNAYKIVKRIYEDEGPFATIITVMLCVGCWQLFWILYFNPSIVEKLFSKKSVNDRKTY